VATHSAVRTSMKLRVAPWGFSMVHAGTEKVVKVAIDPARISRPPNQEFQVYRIVGSG
jgi:hypothetical protein